MVNVKVMPPDELEEARVIHLRVELTPEEADALGEDYEFILARIVQVRNYIASTFQPGGNGGATIPGPVREQLKAQARARPKPARVRKALSGAKAAKRAK